MNRSGNVKQLEETIKVILLKEWNLNENSLKEIFEKYELSDYIDVCYEEYNSMGNKGILEDLQEYIKLLDNTIK